MTIVQESIREKNFGIITGMAIAQKFPTLSQQGLKNYKVNVDGNNTDLEVELPDNITRDEKSSFTEYLQRVLMDKFCKVYDVTVGTTHIYITSNTI